MSFFNFKKPGIDDLEAFVKSQSAQRVTYDGLLEPTPSFRFTRKRWPLGDGLDVFAKAVLGLEAWAVYPSWMTLYPKRAPLQKDVVVALVAGVSSIWTLSAVRITKVEAIPQRFSFTLGTIPQHAVSGAERFSVFLDEHEKVWYELTALSKPRHPLVKLGAPVLRLVQAQFARDSVRSLERFLDS